MYRPCKLQVSSVRALFVRVGCLLLPGSRPHVQEARAATVAAEAYGRKPWLVRKKIRKDDGALALTIEAGDHRLQLERVQRRHSE